MVRCKVCGEHKDEEKFYAPGEEVCRKCVFAMKEKNNQGRPTRTKNIRPKSVEGIRPPQEFIITYGAEIYL